jgi:hypothetical protein
MFSVFPPNPFLCTGFFFFKRLLLRSGRRANGIAREGKGQRRERSGGIQIFSLLTCCWVTLWWCLFNVFLLWSETFAQMQSDAAGKGKETTARAKKTTGLLGKCFILYESLQFLSSSFFL